MDQIETKVEQRLTDPKGLDPVMLQALGAVAEAIAGPEQLRTNLKVGLGVCILFGVIGVGLIMGAIAALVLAGVGGLMVAGILGLIGAGFITISVVNGRRIRAALRALQGLGTPKRTRSSILGADEAAHETCSAFKRPSGA